jgi:hypothetical protein
MAQIWGAGGAWQRLERIGYERKPSLRFGPAFTKRSDLGR